jgi:hypothetical protein
MPTYVSSTLSRSSLASQPTLQNGSFSSTLDNKLVQYGKIANKVSIKNAKPSANIKNKKVKTANSSASLLSNNAYNRFSSIRPTVIYSLKKR